MTVLPSGIIVPDRVAVSIQKDLEVEALRERRISSFYRLGYAALIIAAFWLIGYHHS
jgi:hypothetical protein